MERLFDEGVRSNGRVELKYWFKRSFYCLIFMVFHYSNFLTKAVPSFKVGRRVAGL